MGNRSRVILLVAILALLAPLAASSGAARLQAQVGNDPPLPVAGLGQHPRLLITPRAVAEILQPRWAADAPTSRAFAAYVGSQQPEEDAGWTPGTALRSLALAWLITGETQYADRARRIMLILTNRVENHPTMIANQGFDGVFMEDVAALAVGYDWLHNALTPEDRAALRATLWRAAKRLRMVAADTNGLVWIDGQLSAFGNYEPRWLWALTAVALALRGEHDDVGTLIDFTRQTFTETFIPALNIQTGGAWAEGPVYGWIANWPKAQTALAWWTAMGENYFDDTGWWYDRLAYDMFLYHPASARSYNEDWGDLMPSYPSIIGDSERYHAAFALGRAQDALLQAVFKNTEYGNWMAWYLRQPIAVMPGWMSSEEFLWRDPDWPGAQPVPTTWYAPYLGHVFMRSRWTSPTGQLDETATYVSFNAGDRLAYHQFYDQGNFTIFHNGEDLLVRSGVYSGDGTSDHDANYYARAIAANTILICDLGENFDGIRPNAEREVWVNDCGQRAMNPASRTAINVDYLLANWRAYDTGSITRLGEIGDATYLRADITGAYNSTVYATPENDAKVSAVIRELVYWRPGTVIVFDRVVTTYPTYTPMVVFHFQNQPSPTGLFFGSLVNGSAIYMQNLKPNSTVTLRSGFEVGGLVMDRSWGQPLSNNFERDPYGFFRLEITPGQPNLDHWFMTAFVAQDADQPPPPDGLLIEGQNARGVATGSTQVVFDPQPDDGRDVTEVAFQIAPGVEYALVTGLVPGGDYLLAMEGSASGTVRANNAGMLLIPNAVAGTVRLQLNETTE